MPPVPGTKKQISSGMCLSYYPTKPHKRLTLLDQWGHIPRQVARVRDFNCSRVSPNLCLFPPPPPSLLIFSSSRVRPCYYEVERNSWVGTRRAMMPTFIHARFFPPIAVPDSLSYGS